MGHVNGPFRPPFGTSCTVQVKNVELNKRTIFHYFIRSIHYYYLKPCSYCFMSIQRVSK
jgi:hypothetical protein